MKTFEVTFIPPYTYYIFIVATRNEEDALQIAFNHARKQYVVSPFITEERKQETLQDFKVKELPLEYKGNKETILCFGGHEG